MVSKLNIVYFQQGFPTGDFAEDPIIEVNRCRSDFGPELFKKTGCHPHNCSLTGYHPLRPFSAAVLSLRIYGRKFVRSSYILDLVISFRFKGNVVIVVWEFDLNPVLCL